MGATGASRPLRFGLLIADRHLGGATAWGIVAMGAAIGGIAGGAVALRWKPDRPLIPAFLVMLLAQIELLLLVPPPFPALVVAVGAFVTIASIVISNTLWVTPDAAAAHPARRAEPGQQLRLDGSPHLPAARLRRVGPLSERFGVTQTLAGVVVIGLAG